MPYYHYEQVSANLFQKLSDDLSNGDSTVLLGPRHSGKRYTVRRIAEALDRRSMAAMVLQLSRDIRTPECLSEALAKAIGERDAFDIFDSIDRYWRRQQRPLILLVPNLDVLPHSLIQRFLQGVRVRVEKRTLIVLLGGDQQFRDFVHGPNSEFNCTKEYVLRGYDEEEFLTLIGQYAPQFTFAIGPEARRELWINTGGQPLALRVLLDQAVEERAKSAIGRNEPMTVEEARFPPRASDTRNNAVTQMFAGAAENLRRSPEAWRDLEALIEDPSADVAAPIEPGALELSGLAVRDAEYRLRFSSPLAERYARFHFTPRRLADLCGMTGMWDMAFARYRVLGRDQWLRPENAADRMDVEQALHSLANHMASKEDAGEVLQAFANGAKYLLGFQEVSHWRRKGRWTLCDGKFPDESEYAFSRSIPMTTPNKSQLLELPEPWSRCALAATIGVPGEDTPWIVCLSDTGDQHAISRDRLHLARDFFHSFLAAYDHAGQIQFLKRQIATKERHVGILDSILETVGLLAMDRASICRRVAHELRKLGYHRVLLCLVDRERNRIRGVWDESDQKPAVDIAWMTDWELKDRYGDLQPFVISTGKPFATDDASKEMLANPRVYTAAAQKGIAIVPMLDGDGEAIGTIHVERTDFAKPTQQEIDDLTSFGRRLALILDHAERATLLNKSLDRFAEPVAVLDPSFRWRYANETAAKLLGIPQGWRSWAAATTIDKNSPLYEHMARAMKADEKGDDQLSASELADLQKPGDRFHVSAAPLRDAAREINGAFLGMREFTKVQQLVDVVDDVIRPGSAEQAVDVLLKGMERMGHPSSRVWLVHTIDGKDRLVSYRAIGLPDDDQRRFNGQEYLLAERDITHHSWRCLEGKQGVIYLWDPQGIDGRIVHTARGLRAQVVTQPEHVLGKKPGDYWIDLPLISAIGKPLGKLSTHIKTDLDAQQFWVFQLLASLVSAVIDVFFEHDRQQQWIESGYQKSLATISHHLMNRVIALDPLHWRFERAVKYPEELPEVTSDFKEVLGTITATIRRAQEFLKPPVPNPTQFDLLPLCQHLVSTHLPASVRRSVCCPEEGLMVTADRDLIRIAFAEILSNHRRALGSVADPQFQLEISSKPEEHVHVRFADNGQGVPESVRDRIFDDFFSSWGDGRRSTGLGLGWARRVMRAHKGDLTLDASHSPGACFEAVLPRASVGAIRGNGK